MAMQQPQTAKDLWELVGVVVGATLGLAAIVRWPLKWAFEAVVIYSLKERMPDLRKLLDEEYRAEIQHYHEIATTAKAAMDKADAVYEIQMAHGIALRDVPRMSAVMDEMKDTLSELKDTIRSLHADIRDHGTDIGEIRGVMQGGGWTGEERRKKGRRHEDPPQGEHE